LQVCFYYGIAWVTATQAFEIASYTAYYEITVFYTRLLLLHPYSWVIVNQDKAGRGSEQPDLVEDVPAHCKEGFGLDDR